MSGQDHRRRSSRWRSSRWRVDPRRRAVVLLGGLALILAVAVGVPLALSGQTDLPPVSAQPTGSAALETPPPSFGTPVGSASASPSPGAPSPAGAVVAKRIRIVRLGIDVPIVEGDGIDAPLNKAAHYPGTAWPGGGSNIYLYAHARTGMFLPLWNAQVGDQVVLDLVDGSQRTYVVTQILPKVRWNDMRVVAPTPSEQLTLQTCDSYQQTAPRFVVIAVPQT